MGKKSKIKALMKKGAGGGEDSEDEDATIGESLDDGLNIPTTKSSSRSLVSEAVALLTEKRASMREKGWEQLIKHFQTSFESPADIAITGYQETIMVQLLRTIRLPPSLKEGLLCMDVICLLSLHLGPEEDEFLSQIEQPLRKLVIGTHSGLVGLQSRALSCLAFATFISGGVDAGYRLWNYCGNILRDEPGPDDLEIGSDGSSDTSDTHSSVEVDKSKESIANRMSVRSAAATSWVLLATLRTPEEVLAHCLGDENSSLLEALLDLLQYHDGANAGSMEIKIAAGKSVAYLWEVAAGTAGEAVEPRDLGGLLCHDHHIVDKVLEIVQQVARDSSKRISKKDRKEQRSEFRAVEDLIFRGEGPADSVRMQGAVLEVASFKELLVVEALRTVLGSGFHSALRMFEVVKDVLGVEFVTTDMDGAGQDLRVNKGSSVDKSRSNCRKQDRRYRAMETDFGEGDFGED